MTTPDPDLDIQFSDEPIEVDHVVPVGASYRVHFSSEEARELFAEMRRTGETAGTLIRRALFADIRRRREQAERRTAVD